MPTQRSTRRVREKIEEVSGRFPPEGIREPFKPIDITWTERFSMGTGGMNVASPADALRPNEATSLNNVKVKLGRTEPAWGYATVGDAASAANPILEINNYRETTGVGTFVRIDSRNLEYWDGTSWTTVNGKSGEVMTGASDQRIRSDMVLNQLIFVNGIDDPKVWDASLSEYQDLTSDSNRPLAPRHVISFASRAVFADTGSEDARNASRLEWSTNGDSTNFTDLGAGGVTLADGQRGAASDNIKGLTVQGNFLVIFRRRSIWIARQTGQASAPFEFDSRVQGLGVWAENSLSDVGRVGTAFLSDENVFIYKPGQGSPVPIGTTIFDRILEVLDDTKIERVFSMYVNSTSEFWLFVPDSDDTWPSNAFVFDTERLVRTGDMVWAEYSLSDGVTAAMNAQTSDLSTKI